jgi:integrase
VGWHKSKRDGKYDVYVYDPSIGRKRYVGRRALEREAKQLFRERTAEFLGEARAAAERGVTCEDYAPRWLDLHHGAGTRRPARTTLEHNEQMLRAFLREFGDRPMDGGITRGEALAWSREHPYNARAVSAMFNDAIDDEATQANPFRNRRQEQPRGRQDIFPMTEEEVDRLAEIALREWGPSGYGVVARAWVLFGAWVGTRPGETFSIEPLDLDYENGLVKVTRVKGRKQTEMIVLPSAVQAAIRRMPPPLDAGPLFRTVSGLVMDRKGALHYHWSPIRAAFRQTVTDERWAELLAGQSDQRSLDFYALRHFCASIIVDRGGDEYAVSQQLGNTPDVARRVYIHGYRDRVNERNRERLERGNVVDLGAVRANRTA